MKQKLLALVVLLICGVSAAKAQKISVEAFNRIDRDMGARVAKVRDINSDLCALIKIETIETGFEFSGCIIEKTEQKTGEIWVFVSPGVKFLTIKHKDFGVLRNYNFPQSIESGVVYQMKLSTEAKETKMDTAKMADMIDKKMEELNKKIAELEQKQKQIETQVDKGKNAQALKEKEAQEKKEREEQARREAQAKKEKEAQERKEREAQARREAQALKEKKAQERKEVRLKLPKETFIMLNAAYSVAPQTSVGVTFGMQKTWGWYVSVASGFNFDNLDPNPPLADIDGTGDRFYTGEQTSSRLSLHAGIMYRVAKPLSLKLGLGYGVRNSTFSTSNGDNVLIKNNSHNGLEYSAGVHLSFGRFALSADVLGVGLKFKYSEIKIGIGYNLKIKKHENKEQKGE